LLVVDLLVVDTAAEAGLVDTEQIFLLLLQVDFPFRHKVIL
jgi:hypothetical protein